MLYLALGALGHGQVHAIGRECQAVGPELWLANDILGRIDERPHGCMDAKVRNLITLHSPNEAVVRRRTVMMWRVSGVHLAPIEPADSFGDFA